MIPDTLTKEQLLRLLDTTREGLVSGDTLEASFDIAAVGPDTYHVVAAVRVGNLRGQGGMILFGNPSDPAGDPT